MEVGSHQGSALSPFMFVAMDRLTGEVRQESVFADDTVICSECREPGEVKPCSAEKRSECQ